MEPSNNKIFINDRRGLSNQINKKVQIKMADMAQGNNFNNWATRSNQTNHQRGNNQQITKFFKPYPRKLCKIVRIKENWKFQISAAMSQRLISSIHSINHMINIYRNNVDGYYIFPRKL